MLSWVFRHRARLQAIYGRVEGPQLAGERFRSRTVPGAAIQPAGPDPAPPGELRVRPGGQIEVRPMPRRVA